MHVLIVNDDGPPAPMKSPFILPFVKAAQASGHVVSVVTPDRKRSWMSKAHFRGEKLQLTPYKAEADSVPHWITIDGSPAACVQVGLFHAFPDCGPVDLVISGPNAGQNMASISTLCSGTLGAAMEAALCGKRAVALSFAFTEEDHDLVEIACQKSLSLIDGLCSEWSSDVDVYNINIPLPSKGKEMTMIWTKVLTNRWSAGRFYVPEEPMEANGSSAKVLAWSPNKSDVKQSMAESDPGTDAWAVRQGHISVTPMKTGYAEVGGKQGELMPS